MTNETLKAKAQEYLEPYKDNNRCPQRTYINNFVKYCEGFDKDIADFVSDDFINFLKPHTNPHTAGNVRSIVGSFLEFCGLTSAASELRITKEVIPEFDYILSFEDLTSNIDTVYYEQYKPFGEALNPLACDNLTLGEVVIYLAWIGVPRDSLVKLPLSAINLEKQCVEYQDGDKHYEFSFAGNERIAEVFSKYKKSKYFVTVRNRNGKPQFVNGEYYGDSLIRVNSNIKSGSSNSDEQMKATLSRIFQNYKFAENYKYVYYSGAFACGYNKILQGIMPVFSSDGIMEYFGVVAETPTVITSFKRRWANYLSWRAEIECKSLDIKSLIKAQLRNIVTERLPQLTESPLDSSTKIEITVEELEDLLQVAYNLGSADLK